MTKVNNNKYSVDMSRDIIVNNDKYSVEMSHDKGTTIINIQLKCHMT